MNRREEFSRPSASDFFCARSCDPVAGWLWSAPWFWRDVGDAEGRFRYLL